MAVAEQLMTGAKISETAWAHARAVYAETDGAGNRYEAARAILRERMDAVDPRVDDMIRMDGWMEKIYAVAKEKRDRVRGVEGMHSAPQARPAHTALQSAQLFTDRMKEQAEKEGKPWIETWEMGGMSIVDHTGAMLRTLASKCGADKVSNSNNEAFFLWLADQTDDEKTVRESNELTDERFFTKWNEIIEGK